MNLSALSALFIMLMSFSNARAKGDTNEVFTQMELAKMTELLHGQGCTIYKKQNTTYFISISKEEKTENRKKEPFRIAQIRASHQALIFLRSEFKQMVEMTENGEMKQSIRHEYLPEITPLHSMIIDNDAKNHVIQYKQNTDTFYIFYSKI